MGAPNPTNNSLWSRKLDLLRTFLLLIHLGKMLYCTLRLVLALSPSGKQSDDDYEEDWFYAPFYYTPHLMIFVFSSFPSCLCSRFFTLDPCTFTECAYYAVCISQRDGSAQCQCSDLCPASFSPVCGSNLRTYWNECYLKREACFMKQNTTVSSKEPCSKLTIYVLYFFFYLSFLLQSFYICCRLILPAFLFSLSSFFNFFQDPTPCSGVTCSFHGTCRLTKHGTPYCECRNSCVEIYRPVCGSDGESYFSECFLQSNACRLRKRITSKYNGHCSKSVCLLCFLSLLSVVVFVPFL